MSNSLSSASADTADQLENSLQILIRKFREIIGNVSDAFKSRDSMDQFLLSEPMKLFEIVAVYKDCFQNLQIEKRHQLDSILAKHYRTTKIEEYANGLLEAETDWDELLDGIDTALITEQQKSSTLDVSQCDLLESRLINVRDGVASTLEDYLKTMDCAHLLLILLRHFA